MVWVSPPTVCHLLPVVERGRVTCRHTFEGHGPCCSAVPLCDSAKMCLRAPLEVQEVADMADEHADVPAADLQACSFSAWYNQFSGSTLKSIAVPLPQEFVAYLNSDGVFLGAASKAVRPAVASRTQPEPLLNRASILVVVVATRARIGLGF